MTSETRFTPGPWSVAVKYDGEAPIYRLCVAVKPEQEKANAQLMSASPEIYNELCFLVNLIETYGAHIVGKNGEKLFENLNLTQARKAIMKARGES